MTAAAQEGTVSVSASTDRQSAFARLISPITPEEFERDYYQKRICVVRRNQPDYYSNLLSLEQLDLVLGTHSLKQPEINVVRFEREIANSEFVNSSGIVDPLRAAKLFGEGATLIFSQLQPRIPSLARLCSELGKAFSSRMQTNIYLTPADSQGFPPHWDNHDVFVLQISGSKRWSIYESLQKFELPLRGQAFDPKQQKPGPVLQEFELEAGDMVYIPRGLMHAAHSGAQASLHVTVGLMAYTWADFFVEGVAAAALADAALRESLPFGFADDTFPVSEKARLVREKLARLGSHLEEKPPFPHFSTELLASARPCATNLVQQILGAANLTQGSVIQRRPDASFDYREDESNCVITCYGNRVELPLFASPALQFALRTPRFEIREIPDCIDEAGKLNLVRRLVKEGLLECVSA